MRRSSLFRITLLGILPASAGLAFGAGWTPLTNQPTFNASNAHLLSDGRVLSNEVDSSGFATVKWWILTPDANGSYVNGTWSKAANSNWNHLYYASGLFSDGRLIISGGEYSDAGSETNKTEIYDPVKNVWIKINPPSGWSSIGDAPSVITQDGRLYLGDIFGQRTVFFDPKTMTWTNGPKKLNSQCGEESWTLLPDNTVLSVDCFGHPKTEKWLPIDNKWMACPNTPVDLVLSGSLETGPDVLMPDGRVFAVGGPPATALYTRPAIPSDPGTWAQGPTPPKISNRNIGAEDAPASILPNGNVLIALGPVSSGGGTFEAPTYFFEFDGVNLTRVDDNPVSNRIPYEGRMICLPTGEVFFVNGVKQAYLYSNNMPPDASWRPVVTDAPAFVEKGLTYKVKGRQLNGVSTGSSYGDECNVATNFPLARLRNLQSGVVTYARTHDHSTMGVQTGSKLVSTHFDVPGTLVAGKHELEVAASGIGSNPVPVYVANTSHPTTFSVVDGIVLGETSGMHAFRGIGKLQKSDDDYISVFADPRVHLVTPIQVVIRTTLGSTLPDTLAVVVETGASVIGVVRKTELFNWQTNAYETIDVRPATTEDSTDTLQPSGDPVRFVDPSTGEAIARVSFLAPLEVPKDYSARFDRFGWLFGP